MPRLEQILQLDPGEILRFAMVGIGATATHFGVLTLAVEAFGINPAVANGLAFCIAVCVTYLGQSYWVFSSRSASPSRMAKFLATAFGGMVANVAIMAASVDLFGLPYQVGFAISLVVVPASTFLANKFWVFGTSRRE
ncbi:MAG: GtrA family protein [Pseudomonadota bacterium]